MARRAREMMWYNASSGRSPRIILLMRRKEVFGRKSSENLVKLYSASLPATADEFSRLNGSFYPEKNFFFVFGRK